MKWFSNLKIRTKLISCFIILALFTAVVGLIGISNMRSINGRVDAMYQKDLLPVQNLAQIQKNLLIIRSDLLLLIYEQNSSQFQPRVSEINELGEQNVILLNKYGLTLETPEERQLYRELNENTVPYKQLRTQLITLIQEGKLDQAVALIPQATAAREKVEKGVEDLVASRTASAHAKSVKNKADFQKQSLTMIAIILAGILLAIAFGLVIAAIISRPLYRLVGAANKIAQGDLDVAIQATSTDEVGDLTRAFSTMAENTNRVLTNINAAAEQVSSGARQVSDSSIALSQGAAEQASSIEELTASIEEIASHTRQNADNANDAKSFAEAAKANAFDGNRQMQEMLKSMDEINEASGNIYRIIKVIDEIAFQTNILALNAAVEAARAGQHGKGFAVVAEEVRNLAARSANAAKETTALIESSMQKVECGTKIANETANALDKIVEGIARVANLAGDIAVASNEQATGIAQINQGIMQVSQVVQTNSATSEESAAASEELSQHAALLKNQVNMFKLKHQVNGFGLEEITPEVLQALENLNDKKKTGRTSQPADIDRMAGVSKIMLSDNEFGKY